MACRGIVGESSKHQVDQAGTFGTPRPNTIPAHGFPRKPKIGNGTKLPFKIVDHQDTPEAMLTAIPSHSHEFAYGVQPPRNN
jgi:hypothetical protein